ncbi:hypothetical protein [Bradyrhizobium sp. BR 10289]|uniref:hypothetical protein n=1 Tax=Bradyrhizobium sp. BR 10289 TaxID=2749993 RepID=UPI001C653849|nr:hypothetical protein [Bradyrhizobium sp. BR 10289]MBW7971290.1 hypothetical protein [Bradyrhizobium sp. BR 10289]
MNAFQDSAAGAATSRHPTRSGDLAREEIADQGRDLVEPVLEQEKWGLPMMAGFLKRLRRPVG